MDVIFGAISVFSGEKNVRHDSSDDEEPGTYKLAKSNKLIESMGINSSHSLIGRRINTKFRELKPINGLESIKQHDILM